MKRRLPSNLPTITSKYMHMAPATNGGQETALLCLTPSDSYEGTQYDTCHSARTHTRMHGWMDVSVYIYYIN